MAALPKFVCRCGRLRAATLVGPQRYRFRKHDAPGNVDEPCPGSGDEITIEEAATRAEALAAEASPAAGVEEGTPIDGHSEPTTYPTLPPTVTDGLTIYGRTLGAQMRPAHCADDETVLALLIADEAPKSPDDSGVVFIDKQSAQYLRDLLNIATARGML